MCLENNLKEQKEAKMRRKKSEILLLVRHSHMPSLSMRSRPRGMKLRHNASLTLIPYLGCTSITENNLWSQPASVVCCISWKNVHVVHDCEFMSHWEEHMDPSFLLPPSWLSNEFSPFLFIQMCISIVMKMVIIIDIAKFWKCHTFHSSNTTHILNKKLAK